MNTMATAQIIETQAISQTARLSALPVYLLLGIAFGIVLTKSEVVSWFRIQEMFRFQSFRMYGIIGTATAKAATAHSSRTLVMVGSTPAFGPPK